MENRPNNGLIDFELQQKINNKNISRTPLVNEMELDVTGLQLMEYCKNL